MAYIVARLPAPASGKARIGVGIRRGRIVHGLTLLDGIRFADENSAKEFLVLALNSLPPPPGYAATLEVRPIPVS